MPVSRDAHNGGDARGTPSDPLAEHRDAFSEYVSALRAVADPECPICKGKGTTKGYIAPSKTATYACPCTGQADWQQ